MQQHLGLKKKDTLETMCSSLLICLYGFSTFISDGKVFRCGPIQRLLNAAAGQRTRCRSKHWDRTKPRGGSLVFGKRFLEEIAGLFLHGSGVSMLT